MSASNQDFEKIARAFVRALRYENIGPEDTERMLNNFAYNLKVEYPVFKPEVFVNFARKVI
jgi:hypothetical protein